MEYKKEDYKVYKHEEDNKYRMDDGGCSRVIWKDVSLVANVKVMPVICINENDIEAKCVGHVHLSECKKQHIKEECEFCIKQDVTLRIPVHFDADTEVEEKGIVCHFEEPCDEDCDDDK
ncbi:MAG: hypothetical protein K0R71_1732 [Bacillales bacterium]|jgi:hypothetical protein|nr:hypothetical protein [Bacillales bacterium]